MRRVLAFAGDANSAGTWSGTPHYFLKAGRRAGFLESGLTLKPEKLKFQRLIWNAQQFVGSGEKGGFQYSPFFLKKLYSQANLNDDPVEIISHFPLLPPSPWNSRCRVNFYIDATLKQVFEDYGQRDLVGPKVRGQAMVQEQLNYTQCDRIICMSRWAAASVAGDYKISPAKIHIIPPGANWDEDSVSRRPPSEGLVNFSPLRLGFVGKDWRRKGLPNLILVAEELHARGVAVEVLVVGPRPQELPKNRLLRPAGFVDKGSQLAKFIDLVQSCHFGCLFSSAEAFGISNLEFLRSGVPVLASRVGGIPDTVPDGCGTLFEPDDAPGKIADILEFYVKNPAAYQALRGQVAARASEFSWDRTVEKFVKLWQGSRDFTYVAPASR